MSTSLVSIISRISQTDKTIVETPKIQMNPQKDGTGLSIIHT